MIVSRPVRQFAALALPALLAMIVYGAVIKPTLRNITANRQEAVHLTQILGHFRERASHLPELAAQAAQLHQADGQVQGYLPGDSEPLAAAALQERLKAIVAQARGQLTSIQVLPAQTSGEAMRVTARGEMTLDIRGLERALYTIESETPYLFVDTLDVHALSGAGGNDAKTRNALDIRFDISGYVRKPAS
jgi:hypothetical protein